MNKAWPSEPHRCAVVTEKTEKCILRDMVRTYQRRGWDKIAPLHGCDTDGRVQRAALPRVYATIKSKCIPK
jgi:nitrate reductase cytochrome c-type subunit